MLKLNKIAVTGNLASGKSTLCDLLKQQGAFLVSTDNIVHDILSSDQFCIEKIIQLLGEEVIIDHHIDRKKVATLIFSNPKKLHELEKILHPIVFERINTLYKQACDSEGYNMFVVEVPLLFEVNWNPYFDITLTVYADRDLRKNRFMNKGFSSQDFEKREERFLPQDKKVELSTYSLYNDYTIDALQEQLSPILNILSTPARPS